MTLKSFFLFFLRCQVLSPRCATAEASAAVTAGLQRYPPADDSGKSAAADPPPDRPDPMTSTLEQLTDKAGPEL